MKFGIAMAVPLLISLLPVCSVAHKDSVHEYKIAGLNPGSDTIDKAYGRFHKDRVIKELSSPNSAVWIDPCNRQMLTVVFDTRGIIQEVRIEPLPTEADCSSGAYSRSVKARIGSTGRGLVFQDRCDRVQQIYGSPQSEGRSTNGDEELVYRFKRGVKGTLLTLEVTCGAYYGFMQVWTIKLKASVSPKP